jgi:HPt (histidine-containing phosphotransfer) domain-containing protein
VSEEAETIIDWAGFSSARSELGADFLRILGYFREDGVKSVVAVEDAMRSADAAAMVLPAHTLKGEASQFGAEALADLAEKIEMIARQSVEWRQSPDEALPEVLLHLSARPIRWWNAVLSDAKPKLPISVSVSFRRDRSAFAFSLRLQLNIVGDAHLADHVELPLERIDVFFFSFENVREDVAGHIVAHCLTIGDTISKRRKGFLLERQIGLQNLLDRLSDAEASEKLEVRQAIEKKDALRQRVSMFHLIDGFAIFEFGELMHAPMIEHPVMQEILVDRGQLVLERRIQKFDDLWVALHGTMLRLKLKHNIGVMVSNDSRKMADFRHLFANATVKQSRTPTQ